MSGSAIQLKFDDREVQEAVRDYVQRMQDLTPVMKIVGNIVRSSIVRNFEKEGRPMKWKKHSKTTEARRGKGAAILRQEGHLMGSIHPEPSRDRVVVGTNVTYAAVHQFGAKKGEFGTITAKVNAHIRHMASGKQVQVREHTRRMALPWGDIPARPYLMVQDEDGDEIRAAIAGYIMRSVGSV